MHIGLTGGIGPAATVFYCKSIVQAFAKTGQQLNLGIAHTSAHTLTANVTAGNAEPQAGEFVRVTKQLVGAGADVVAITSMGRHFCAPQFAALSPLPMINGPDAVAVHLL
jgi:aspartate racemase